MQDRFIQPEPNLGWKMLFVAFLICCLLGLSWVLHKTQRRQRKGRKPKPVTMSLRIQHSLNMGWMDCFLLWRMARVCNEKEPTTLLISDTRFDEAATAYCTRTSWLGDPADDRLRCAAVRARLFGPAKS